MNEDIYLMNPDSIKLDCIDKADIKGYINCGDNSLRMFAKKENRGLLVIPDIKEDIDRVIEVGLIEFKDYIIDKYYKKKIVVIYGNCHSSIIAEILSSCSSFLNEYIVYPTLPIHLMKSAEDFEHPVFRHCDIFIHQSIRSENRYGKEFASDNIIKRLKPQCQVIAIPNVYHLPMCFFPQYSPEKEFVSKNNETIFFRDAIIDKLYSQGFSKKRIVEEYRNNNLFEKDMLDKSFLSFIHKLELRERDWDIKISNYIIENYQTQKLFYDPNHPTTPVLKYIAKRILELLDVNYDKNEMKEMNVSLLDSYEMPIISSAKKHLNMTYDDSEMRVSGRKMRDVKMGLEEYVMQYLAFEWQNSGLSILLRMKSLILYGYLRYPDRIIRKVTKYRIKCEG